MNLAANPKIKINGEIEKGVIESVANPPIKKSVEQRKKLLL